MPAGKNRIFLGVLVVWNGYLRWARFARFRGFNSFNVSMFQKFKGFQEFQMVSGVLKVSGVSRVSDFRFLISGSWFLIAGFQVIARRNDEATDFKFLVSSSCSKTQELSVPNHNHTSEIRHLHSDIRNPQSFYFQICFRMPCAIMILGRASSRPKPLPASICS